MPLSPEAARFGLPLHSHLRSGFAMKDLGTFNRAFVESIQMQDPRLIPDELVQECAASPIAGLTCVYALAGQGKVDLLEAALNDTAEQCKRQGGGRACDDWGSWYGLRFGRG